MEKGLGAWVLDRILFLKNTLYILNTPVTKKSLENT